MVCRHVHQATVMRKNAKSRPMTSALQPLMGRGLPIRSLQKIYYHSVRKL